MSKYYSPKEVAALVRSDLKNAFPAVKFSVRSDYSSINVNFTMNSTSDPTAREVESVLSKYKAGSFDGMIDLYEYNETKRDQPTVKYLFVQASDESVLEAQKEAFMQYYGFARFDDQEVFARLHQWADPALRRFVYEVIIPRARAEREA